MPSTAIHRPEMAFDGDLKSYFSSYYGMEDGDDFLVQFSRPISVKSLRIVTGDPEGEDVIKNGFVEVSSDMVSYTKLASFDGKGVASGTPAGLVLAVRIRLEPGKGLSRLIIREISVDTPVTITHVAQGPGRGFIDISQAPDLADWAKRAEKQMEDFWPDAAAILYSDGFITPNMVNVIYKTGPDVTPVAATGGGVMTVNSAYCRQHADDTALTVHEMAHAVQSIGGDAPGWIVEGSADYIRWVKYEPEHFHPRINLDKATYHDAYQTSATFLGWVALKYDSEIITKLNRIVRFGGNASAQFVKSCGKDLDALWTEFSAAYKADPAHIITPPVPAAMKPRTLPTVVAGSSVSVNLASFFNVTGFVADGTQFSASAGFDEGGASFPAKSLSSTVVSHDVNFKLGPAGAPDAIASNGNTIPLPGSAHGSLWLLASTINGGHRDLTVAVTYTDGTVQKFAQNFSDWYLPSGFPGESRAAHTDYRAMADGGKDPRTFYVYSYGYPLDAKKTVKSVTLPTEPSVRVFAISLAK